MVKQEAAFSFRMSPELRQLADILYDNVISTGVYHIKVGGSINETLVGLMKVGAYHVRDHLKATGGWDSFDASLAENEVPVMTALMSWLMANPDADHIPAHAALSEFPPGPVQEFIDRHYHVDIEPGEVAEPLSREWIAERYAHAISHQKLIKRVVDHIDNMADAKSAASTAQAQAAADALGIKTENRQQDSGVVSFRRISSTRTRLTAQGRANIDAISAAEEEGGQ